MRRAVYPGSFDPVTFGHLDIIMRAEKLSHELIVAVLKNSSKNSLFPVEERVEMLKSVLKGHDSIKVMSFSGLTVEFAKELECDAIVRGLRAVSDFEYELQIAQTNHVQQPDIETIFLTTNLKYSYLSSTVVKEFAAYGGEIDKFVPEEIIDKVFDAVKRSKR